MPHRSRDLPSSRAESDDAPADHCRSVKQLRSWRCGSAVGRGRVFARLLLVVSCEARFVNASPDRGGVFDLSAVLVVYEVGGAVEGVGPAGPVHDVVMKRA